MRYKQACVYEVTESGRIRGTELYRQQKPLHVRWSWKVTSVWIKHGRNGRVNFEQSLVLIHCPHWIVSWETVYAISQMLAETTIDSVRSWRPTGKTQLISSCDNVKHDLESLLEQIGFSSFLSLARIITFSPPQTRSKPPGLEALYSFPPFTV